MNGNHPQSVGVVGPRLELEEAVKRSDESEVRRLLENGADPNARGAYGRTALHYAAVFGRIAIIKALVSYDAVVNVQDADGYTPLHRAAQSGHLESVQYLLNAGADPDLKTGQGLSARKAIIDAGYADLLAPADLEPNE